MICPECGFEANQILQQQAATEYHHINDVTMKVTIHTVPHPLEGPAYAVAESLMAGIRETVRLKEEVSKMRDLLEMYYAASSKYFENADPLSGRQNVPHAQRLIDDMRFPNEEARLLLEKS